MKNVPHDLYDSTTGLVVAQHCWAATALALAGEPELADELYAGLVDAFGIGAVAVTVPLVVAATLQQRPGGIDRVLEIFSTDDASASVEEDLAGTIAELAMVKIAGGRLGDTTAVFGLEGGPAAARALLAATTAVLAATAELVGEALGTDAVSAARQMAARFAVVD